MTIMFSYNNQVEMTIGIYIDIFSWLDDGYSIIDYAHCFFVSTFRYGKM